MMAKRKRSIVQPPSKKRSKGAPQSSPSGSHPHGEVDPEREYKLKSIVGETAKKYLISWEDDEKTGEQYADTWEPKENANPAAIDDWKKQKADKKRIQAQSGKENRSRSNSFQRNVPQPVSPSKQATPSRRTGRNRRVVESSPTQGPTSQTNGHTEQPPEEDLPEIDESPEQSRNGADQEPEPENPLFLPEYREAVGVALSDPPSSYLHGGYHPEPSQPASTFGTQVSEIAVEPAHATQASELGVEPSQYLPDPGDTSKSTEDTTEVSLAPTTPSEQTRSVPVNFGTGSTNIVPDSQSVPDSASYLPSTLSHSSPAQQTYTRTLLSPELQSSTAPDRSTDLDEPGYSPPPAHLSSSLASERQEEAATVDPRLLQIHDEPSIATTAGPTSHRQASESLGRDFEAVVTELAEPEEQIPEEHPAQTAEGIDDNQQLPSSDQTSTASTTDIPANDHESEPLDTDLETGAADNVERLDQALDEDSTQSAEDTHVSDQQLEGHSQIPVAATGSTPPRDQAQDSVPLEEDLEVVAADQTERGEQASAINPSPAAEDIETSDQLQFPAFADSQQPARVGSIESETRTDSPPEGNQQANNRHRQYLSIEALLATQPDQNSQALPSVGEPTPVQPTRQALLFQQEPPRAASPFTQQTPAHIDLSSSQQPTSIRTFSVSPPPRKQPTNKQKIVGPPASSSGWFSSFPPFETQIPRESSFPRIRPTLHRQSSGQPRATFTQHSTIISRQNSVPPHDLSSLHTSSPIAAAPSQSLGVNDLGESAPPRPTTPSSPLRLHSQPAAMSASQTPSTSGGSLSAKLKAMRASQQKLRQERQQGETSTPSTQKPKDTQSIPTAGATLAPPKLGSPLLLAEDRVRDRHRSPSAVPALQPLPVITLDEMTTSARYETLQPQSQGSGSDERQRNGSLTGTATPTKRSANEDAETASIHVVPICLIGHQRDDYPSTVWHYGNFIEGFLANPNPDPALLTEAKGFVDRIRRLVMHPDLNNPETVTQFDVEPSQQRQWDIDSSAKFRFLAELLNRLRDQNLHLVIMSRPGRIHDILDTFLRGLDISFDRPGISSVANRVSGFASLRVTILETNYNSEDVEPADCIIAMDNSVDPKESHVRSLRQRDGKWAPFVTLVVPNSVEHIERCLSSTLSDQALYHALVNGINRLRKEAGKLGAGAFHSKDPPKEAGALLAQYLISTDAAVEWNLPVLNNLEDLDSQTESEIPPPGSESNIPSSSNIGEKRSREPEDVEMEDQDSKRARVEVPATELGTEPHSTNNAGDMDVTHISDSIEKATQSNTADAETSPELSKTEKRLQKLVQDLQDRVEQQVRDLDGLQGRVEAQHSELADVKKERDSAIMTAERAVARMTEESNRASSLRASNTSLKGQLQEANAKLLDHSIPERAEYEALRLEVAQAKMEKERAESRRAQVNSELEYAQRLYQDASNRAQAHASEITELQNQLAVAQNRATGEHTKLRQMGYDSFTKNLREENKQLKVQLKDREAGLKLRDEEIARSKEASRGRMGTRGTSVPRSPRVSSPMKTVEARSRQSSPAVGDLRQRTSLLNPHASRGT